MRKFKTFVTAVVVVIALTLIVLVIFFGLAGEGISAVVNFIIDVRDLLIHADEILKAGKS